MSRRPSVTSQTTFGVRLREARTRVGIAQDRLGVLAGLDELSSSARISRYETGVHQPEEKFARRLGELLGVPLAYLYCDDDLVAELLLRIDALTVAKRRELLQHLDGKNP